MSRSHRSRPRTVTTVREKLTSGSRVVADTVLGYALVAAGLVMLITPGPGLLALVAGLAMLSRHYTWATRVRAAIHDRFHDTLVRTRSRWADRRSTPVPARRVDRASRVHAGHGRPHGEHDAA